MNMSPGAPGEVELYAYFSIHLGLGSRPLGCAFSFTTIRRQVYILRCRPPKQYRGAILKGIEDGMALRFPKFPDTGSIWIIEVTAHDVDSSQRAFYRAGRLVIDQAYSLTETAMA